MTPAEVQAKVLAYLLNTTSQPFWASSMIEGAQVIAADIMCEVGQANAALQNLIDEGYVHYVGNWLYSYQKPRAMYAPVDTACPGRIEVNAAGPFTSRPRRQRLQLRTRPPSRLR